MRLASPLLAEALLLDLFWLAVEAERRSLMQQQREVHRGVYKIINIYTFKISDGGSSRKL
jgi:hypothetical protein